MKTNKIMNYEPFGDDVCLGGWQQTGAGVRTTVNGEDNFFADLPAAVTALRLSWPNAYLLGTTACEDESVADLPAAQPTGVAAVITVKEYQANGERYYSAALSRPGAGLLAPEAVTGGWASAELAVKGLLRVQSIGALFPREAC